MPCHNLWYNIPAGTIIQEVSECDMVWMTRSNCFYFYRFFKGLPECYFLVWFTSSLLIFFKLKGKVYKVLSLFFVRSIFFFVLHAWKYVFLDFRINLAWLRPDYSYKIRSERYPIINVQYVTLLTTQKTCKTKSINHD